MTTNRPFLSNFLAAFRAQSTFQHPVSPPPSQSGNKPHQSYSTTASSAPANTPSTHHQDARPTATSKTSTTAAVREATTTSHSQTPFQPTHRPHASYWDKTPGSPNGPTSPSSPPGFPIPGASSRHRRGSDSSSDGGFRERTGSSGGSGASGAGSSAMEKWFIGGRTADGEERFYKLGMVRRIRSSDRLSLDRLSL
ncbi:uncharacterized protein IWZ02DRAFT_56229 [Phyllosticta citriasiana]|uniref:Uncharacterized protein n=1 Tax=Phyllosticta citriasiana TaxID=595635 RepID=A0ABR1L0R7_9PEZI